MRLTILVEFLLNALELQPGKVRELIREHGAEEDLCDGSAE